MRISIRRKDLEKRYDGALKILKREPARIAVNTAKS